MGVRLALAVVIGGVVPPVLFGGASASAASRLSGASGVTFTWTGGGGVSNENWSDGANWTCTGTGCTSGTSTPISIPYSAVDFPSASESTIDQPAVVHTITIASADTSIEANAPFTAHGPAELAGTFFESDPATGPPLTFSGPVTLAGGITLFSPAVTFGSTVNSAPATANPLVVMGDATFDGDVGGVTPLSELNVAGATRLAASVTASSQIYQAITVRRAVTLTGSEVEFFSTVDGAASLTVAGNGAFMGAVGGVRPLQALTVTGTASIDANVTTTGSQTYEGTANLGAFPGPSSDTLAGSTVTFQSTVAASDNPTSLSIVGDANFDGDVGTVGDLQSLAVSGTTTLPATVFTLGAGQTYSGGVTLGSNTTLLGDVTFGSTVNSSSSTPDNLTIIVGNATFDGPVGAIRPLGTLTVDDDASLGTNVHTTGAQSYGQVELTGNAALSASSVTFYSVTGDDHDLSIAGPATFSDGASGLRSLRASGFLRISGGTFEQPASAFTSRGLSLGSASTLALSLTGAIAGSGYDELVNGLVSLGGAGLSLTLGFTPSTGQVFTLIHDTSGSAPSGTFAGLPQGSVIPLNGVSLQISYDGGSSGDDVTLTVIG